jgi:ribosomal protein S27AE
VPPSVVSNPCCKWFLRSSPTPFSACYRGSVQTACVHCGQQHLLNDTVLAKHSKVQFRCTKCGKTTIVEVRKRVDETVVISPMPSFARADASTAHLRLPPLDNSLHLPENVDVVLTVISGPGKGQSIVLKAPRLVIGRKGADFALNDPEVSRHHCILEVRDRAINLKDLDSTNGTFFEQERVRAAVLQDGAQFHVGSSTIRLNLQPK